MKIKKAYIEITNICNMTCSFCIKTKRKTGYLDEDNFIEVINKVKPHTSYIYLHVMGEPLLHPKLAKFLDICESKQMKVSITTNATLLHEKSAALQNKSALRQINYSLHSMFENGRDINTQLNDIFAFITATPAIYHCLRLWNSGFTQNDLIISLIKSHFQTEINIPEITSGNGIKVTENVFIQVDKRFTWPDINAAPLYDHGKCYGIKNNIGILLDGTVTPCCLDAEGAVPLGNIYKSTLDEILNSERAKNIRDGFSKSEPREKLCRTCGFMQRITDKQ